MLKTRRDREVLFLYNFASNELEWCMAEFRSELDPLALIVGPAEEQRASKSHTSKCAQAHDDFLCQVIDGVEHLTPRTALQQRLIDALTDLGPDEDELLERQRAAGPGPRNRRELRLQKLKQARRALEQS